MLPSGSRLRTLSSPCSGLVSLPERELGFCHGGREGVRPLRCRSEEAAFHCGAVRAAPAALRAGSWRGSSSARRDGSNISWRCPRPWRSPGQPSWGAARCLPTQPCCDPRNRESFPCSKNRLDNKHQISSMSGSAFLKKHLR